MNINKFNEKSCDWIILLKIKAKKKCLQVRLTTKLFSFFFEKEIQNYFNKDFCRCNCSISFPIYVMFMSLKENKKL